MRQAMRALCLGLALFAGAVLGGEGVTISTNNTPLDRAALEAISREAFGRIGVEVRVVGEPSARSLHSANAGLVDGEGLRVAGLEQQYPNLLRVPEPYVGIQFVAFGLDAGVRLDSGWESLKPYRLAYINGWKLFEKQLADAPAVTKVDEPMQLFQMLVSGRADMVLYTLADGMALARDMGLTQIVALRPPLREADMFLYLHRSQAALLEPLAEALREMKRDGTHARILRELARE